MAWKSFNCAYEEAEAPALDDDDVGAVGGIGGRLRAKDKNSEVRSSAMALLSDDKPNQNEVKFDVVAVTPKEKR